MVKKQDDKVLHDFEGFEVSEALAVVRNAGDGLSEAMHFEPFEVAQGERRFLVLDVTCDDVQFPRVKEGRGAKAKYTGTLARKHIFRASTGVFLDESVVPCCHRGAGRAARGTPRGRTDRQGAGQGYLHVPGRSGG